MIKAIGRNKWRVDVHARRGAPRRRLIVEGTRRAAEDEERRLEDEVRGKLPDSRAAGKITIADLVNLVVNEYRLNQRASIDDAEQMAAKWTREYGHRSAASLTHGDLVAIATRWQAGGPNGDGPLSNARINRIMAILLRGYRLHRRNDPAFPIPYWGNLKESPARSGFLELEDFYRLRDCMDEYIKVPATIANWTGMREGEVLKLEWTRVRFDHNARSVSLDLFSTQTKTKEARYAIFFGDLYRVLADWHRITKRDNPTCAYICHRNGKCLADTRYAWERAAVRAEMGVWAQPKAQPASTRGYTGILFHDLRRSGLRNSLHAGVPRNVVMKISGHKTEKVFERYNIVSPQDLEDAGRKIHAYEQAAEARRIANLAIASGGHLVDTMSPTTREKPRKSRKKSNGAAVL